MSDLAGGPDRPPKRRDDVPEGFDPIGVPRAGAGLDALVLLGALVAAFVGLIVTVGFIVYYRLHH